MTEPVLDSEKQTILVVDDVRVNILILSKALNASYNVLTATNGKEALAIANSKTRPDVILLDVMMPEMDGYEVCRILKSSEETMNIPVIFITAMDSVEDEELGFELGAVDYITKPFKLRVVQARVRTHMELKRKTDMLAQFAFLDGLTDIYNRRRFDKVFLEEWRRCNRRARPLSLIMMDIDAFKPYNDYYGHAAGDECLKTVARTLVSSVSRPADLVARYGGEEFIGVLPETGCVGACLVAERMRFNIAELKIPHLHSPVSDQVTLSFGVATIIPTSNRSASDFAKAADEMVYAAKGEGRDFIKSIDLG